MRRRLLAASVFTQLNLHVAAVVLLLVVDLVLMTRLAVAWHDSHSDRSAQFDADSAAYAQLQAQSGRIRALPAQLSASGRQADAFFAARVPSNFSQVVAELGDLANRDHVRLTRAAYPTRAAIPGLVEVRIDGNISGEYPAIMHFINDIERDKNHSFFTIRTVALTGQQGGLVNLRLVMTTYLHPSAADAASLQAGSRASGSETGGETQ